MVRGGVALALILALGGGGRAELRIVKPEVVHTALGLVREPVYYVPGDAIVLRFGVAGVSSRDGSSIDATTTVELRDPAGVVIERGDLPSAGARPACGTEQACNVVQVGLGAALRPGKYTVSVTVKDNGTGASAGFTQPVVLKDAAAHFAVRRIGLFADPERKTPCARIVCVGQRLHFAAELVGLKASDRQDLGFTCSVRDAGTGKELSSFGNASSVATSTTPVTYAALGIDTAPFSRPGAFVLHVTVRDNKEKRSLEFDVPVQVLEP